MPFTTDDLQDFTRFAGEKLANGGAESIFQLAAAWEEARRYDESVGRLRQSEVDVQAGRIRPLDDAFAELCQKLTQRQ